MKCKQGDLARIIHSVRLENIRRKVHVKEYIGKFSQGEDFEFRGMTCRCAVTDHYWWIEAEDLSTLLGPSPQAYIPDTWLEPIRSKELSKKQKIEIDTVM
jgi:hypothetical protein